MDCIPDLDTVSSCRQDEATCIIRPGFAFVRGKLDMTLRVIETVENTSARYQMHTKSMAIIYLTHSG